MKNIMKMYEEYQEKHANEFRSCLENVAKEVLLMTEQLPTEIVEKQFMTNSDRKYLYCDGESWKTGAIEKGNLSVSFNAETLGQFSWNDGPAKKLDEFMDTFYPGIQCRRSYTLNLYDHSIEFSFVFNLHYMEEAFEWPDGRLKNGRINIDNALSLFNDDISVLLNRKFGFNDWEELNRFESNEGFLSNVYNDGWVLIQFSI